MIPPVLDAEPACPPADQVRAAAAASPSAVRPLVAVHRLFESIDRELWDSLAARNPWATPFAYWPFHRAWWDAYGASAHDQTLAVYEAADVARPTPDALHVRPIPGARPVAILPLMHRHEVEPRDAEVHSTMRRDGSHAALTPVAPTAKAVFFGASYHADYATALAAPDDLPSVAEAFACYLALAPDPDDAHPAPWDVVDLRRLRCGDPTSDELSAALFGRESAEGWTLSVEREDVCPVATIPAGVDFEGYLDTLGKKERHEIRRKVRRAEAAGEVRLTESTDPLADLPAFIDLHQKRWGERGLFPDTPGGAASRLFFHRLFELFGPDGPIRLSFLTVGARRVAAGIHIEGADRLYYYNAGVDPDARDLSPGVVMVARYVQKAIDDGCVQLDFLRGDEGYKYEWGAVDEPIQRILLRRRVG